MKKALVAMMMALLLVSAAPVLAQDSGDDTGSAALYNGPLGAEGEGGMGLEYGGELGLGNRDIRSTVAQLIRVLLGLLGIVAVVIILMGGFTWMMAGGSEEKVEEAKKRILQGVVGLAIILSAYALASFVINQLLIATNPDANVPAGG